MKYSAWIPYASLWLRALVTVILFPVMWTGFFFLDTAIFIVSFVIGISIIQIFVTGPSILITYLHHLAFGRGENPIPSFKDVY